MSDPTNQDFACATDCGTGVDESVRPRSLDDFIGQDELRANLRVYLGAARERGKALDHTLFYGNPGLGKTTLAQIMAQVGVQQNVTSVHWRVGEA